MSLSGPSSSGYCDDGQAVGDPAIHFLREDLLLVQQLLRPLEQCFLFALNDAALCHILECQQQRPRVFAFIENLARIRDQRASEASTYIDGPSGFVLATIVVAAWNGRHHLQRRHYPPRRKERPLHPPLDRRREEGPS